MKLIQKIGSLVFLLLFVTETFGIYKFAHFCGNEKTSESIFIKKVDCCCEDLEEENDDCCSNETQIIQFKKEETLISEGAVKKPSQSVLELNYESADHTECHSSFIYKKGNFFSKNHSIPDTPLIIKNCVLLI